MLTGVEIRRKVVHLLSLAIPVGYAWTSRDTALIILVPLFLGFLSADLARRYHSSIASLFQRYFIGTVLRDQEKNRLMGSTYFLLSSVLVIFLFPKSIAVVSLLILILSDTCAAWVGKGIGRVRIFEKTLEGSLAFFLSALIIVYLFPGLNRLAGTLGALGATLVELIPFGLDDNLTIPFAAAAVMFFCGA